jgi:1-deoxy-D-xylulose 5-phosphate reductoisomerase
VEAFLAGLLPFTAIARIIERAMDEYERDGARPVASLDDVRAIERWTRELSGRGLEANRLPHA